MRFQLFATYSYGSLHFLILDTEVAVTLHVSIIFLLIIITQAGFSLPLIGWFVGSQNVNPLRTDIHKDRKELIKKVT